MAKKKTEMIVEKGVCAEGSWRGHTFSPVLFCFAWEQQRKKKGFFWTASRQQLMRRQRKLQVVKGKFVGHKTLYFCRRRVHFFTASIFVVISMEEQQWKATLMWPTVFFCDTLKSLHLIGACTLFSLRWQFTVGGKSWNRPVMTFLSSHSLELTP